LAELFKRDYPVYIAILLISVIYWLGISSVPFHPDESTQLYMSADFKTFLSNPKRLFWRAEVKFDQRQYYREIDPPLSRYLIGAGLALSGNEPLNQDWDWSKTWQQNIANGALPPEEQLTAARFSVAFLFPFSLLFAYWIGKGIHSRSCGWINMGLLALNTLVLIHTRRAMAESPLLLMTLFTLWGITTWKRQRFWLAIPAALAFNAKYSALPLAFVGLLAVWWNFQTHRILTKRKALDGALFIGLFILITWLLNPFLWRSPVPALLDAFSKRQDLIHQQSQAFASLDSAALLDTFGEKVDSLVAHLFFTPPAIEDVSNYSMELKQASQAYVANPFHYFLRGWIGGAITLFLSLAGLVLWTIWLIRGRPLSRSGVLITTAFILQLVAIFVMIRFPFQRYYIPLVPYTTLLVSFGISKMISAWSEKRQRLNKESPS